MYYKYIDENNNLLSFPNYDDIYLYNLINENVAPKNADKIGCFNIDKQFNYVLEDTIPLNSEYASLKHNYGKCLYRVGLISDAHHNDVCNDFLTNDNIFKDLDYALNRFNINNDKIDFICCAGDVTSNNLADVYQYNDHINNVNIPVFTCKGNHDNASIYFEDGTVNNDTWLKNTVPSVLPNGVNELNYFTTGDKTSFWFKKNTDVYIIFNLDYKANSATAVNTLDNDGTNYLFYDEDTIVELQQILDNNRNNRCFIITHHPFVNKAGNVKYEYSRNIDKNYILSGKQFALLNELNNYYTNTIWISGHTTYQFKHQKISNRANICGWDVLNNNYNYNDYNDYGRNLNNKYSEFEDSVYQKCGYCVHVPSVTEPFKLGSNEELSMGASEAGVMSVYDEGVNISGIIFNDPEINKYMKLNTHSSLANYWIPIRSKNSTNIKSQKFEYFESKIKKFNK